jgi:8-oxo-dGTP pyrophosphatase MutT (NUDIX family)
MNQKNVTVAVLHDNKLLLLRRGSTAPWMPDRYCLPGGGVEDGESLVHAASRELYEETRIVALPKHMQSIEIKYSDYSKLVFVTRVTSDKVVLNFEHSESVWVNIGDIMKYKIVPGLSTVVLSLIHHKYLK